MQTRATMADGCCCRAALQATRAPSTRGEAETRGGSPPRERLEASFDKPCPGQPEVDEPRAEDGRRDQPTRGGADGPVVYSEAAFVDVQGRYTGRTPRYHPDHTTV